ncbi:MAG: restriction endonuclease subunit S [Candidatus Poribacteria bacterium]|nr:restriction endonuclease subunit S [Candidatus Poribacteria bacterium]
MKRYPEYKESGVEWIGEIPKHWKIKRLKYVADLNMGQSPPSEEYNSDQIGTPFLQGNAEFGTHHPTPKIYCPTANKHASLGDILVSVRAPVGAINVADQEYGIGRGLCAICPRTNQLECHYAKYLLEVVRIELHVVATGSTYEAVAVDDVSNLICIVPPFSEQTQIANFLDRKTEQIDELIRIKERRIELLQEQRTALINQAVTKGLDPTVEMKPSGVEWIGDIPAHWEVKRLKYVAEILPSNVDKHIYSDDIQIRLCNYTDVYYNDYITVDTVLEKGSCNEREFAKFVLRKGDVIITKDSETPDDIGVPTFVKDDFDDVVCGYHLTMIRPLACRGEFIFRFIQSDRTRKYFELESNGITRYGLGKPSIENLLLPIPTDSEQRQIANFLNHKTKQIDDLIAAEQRKIERLKEYRQSLISEAVTGKIDVRNKV